MKLFNFSFLTYFGGSFVDSQSLAWSSNYDFFSSEPAGHREKRDPGSVDYSDSYSDDYEVDR